jgi:hypothetical protein
MAPANNKILCNGCGTAFPIKKNENSNQGRSFKCCADCDRMAGSNNQKQCKKCKSTNWVKRQAPKRSYSSVKRSAKRESKQPVAKKRKTSGKNMLDDMLALLDSSTKSELSSSKATSIDLLSEYELVGNDSMFDELMADMVTAPKPLTRDSSLTISDDIFDDFVANMVTAPKPLTRDSSLTISDDIFDDFVANMGADEKELEDCTGGWLDEFLTRPSVNSSISV